MSTTRRAPAGRSPTSNEIPPVKPDWPATWKSVRHHFGISAFGINAVTKDAGNVLIPEHDERSSGQEELYFVHAGEVRGDPRRRGRHDRRRRHGLGRAGRHAEDRGDRVADDAHRRRRDAGQGVRDRRLGEVGQANGSGRTTARCPPASTFCAVGDLAAQDGEADRAEPGRVGDRRHPADLALVGGDRRAGLGRARREREAAQAAVGVPAVVQPGDRLLPGIAALREADGPLDEAGLGRHRVGAELAAEPGDARLDPRHLPVARRRSRPAPARRAGTARSASRTRRARRRPRPRRPRRPPARARPSCGSGPAARTSTTSSRVSGGHASTSSAPVLNTSRSEITRAFGVSRRAYAPPPAGIASTSFDTMLWRWATASGPGHPDERAIRNDGHDRSVQPRRGIPGGGRLRRMPRTSEDRKAREAGFDELADPARPVLHRQVAGPARRQRAAPSTSQPGTSGRSAWCATRSGCRSTRCGRSASARPRPTSTA